MPLMDAHSGDIYSVAFHPAKPNVFATVADSGHIHVYDAGEHRAFNAPQARLGTEAFCQLVDSPAVQARSMEQGETRACRATPNQEGENRASRMRKERGQPAGVVG